MVITGELLDTFFHKSEKVSEPIFWGKFSFCPNWAKMAQKWTFFWGEGNE